MPSFDNVCATFCQQKGTERREGKGRKGKGRREGRRKDQNLLPLQTSLIFILTWAVLTVH